MKLLTGNVDLNNVNIRPDKVNELFDKKKLPIALKAGLISKLSIKVTSSIIITYFPIVQSHKSVF